MAWNNAGDTVRGSDGQVYVADIGSTLPTSESSALAPATYKGLGFHTEDGVSLSFAPDVAEFGAWQTPDPIRIERNTADFRLSFALLQWDEDAVPTAFGGGEITTLGGSSYQYSPPSPSENLAEKVVVVDVIDGSEIIRFVIPRGVAVEGVDATFNRGALASLPVTIRALVPTTGGDSWFFITNSTSFAAGS